MFKNLVLEKPLAVIDLETTGTDPQSDRIVEIGIVLATAEILDAMLSRYADLLRTVSELHQHFKDPNAVDSNGCFVRIEGQVQFAFGKYRGQPLDAVARARPDYLRWMLGQDFFEDTKGIVREALSAR